MTAQVATRASRPSKLKSAPPVGRDWPSVPRGAPRSFSVDADQSHYGVRPDDGGFSEVFERVFPGRDYAGLKAAGG